MLEREQHQLSVDLIFDDIQIGDFVKSIQIDSPYQQMLLEGVLTESVREEKLYVTFTIEGYFHHVLGEVIYNQTEGKGAEVLKQIVEENKLNGAKEGIEQCLIRDVNQDKLSRLIWLIDSGGDLLDLCAKPLAHSFLNIKGKINLEIELNQAYKEQIKKVTNELFADPTDNDIEALNNGIAYLEETQKNNVVALLYQQINELIVPDNLRKSILYVKSIMHLPEAVRNSKLQDLANIQIVEESDLATLFFSSLGQQFSFVGDYEKAVECHEKSLSIKLKIHGNLNSSIGASYNNLGEVWREKGDYDKSVDYYEKSLAINLNINGEQHSSVWESYNNLGLIWSDKGFYDKAIEYLEKSLAINFKIHGNHHLSTAITYNNLGSVWSNSGDYEKAIEYLQKTLFIRLKVYSDQHPSVGESYNNLGVVWNEKGDYDKAIEYYEKTLAVDINVFGDQHPSIAITYSNLGSVWRNKSNYVNALDNLGKSLAIYLKVYGDLHPLIGITYTHFGNVFRDKNDPLSAKENYEKAYNIFFKALGADHPHTKLIVQKLNDL
jgi:tetratricopeptide (TPR) repeat protein